ncbi:MAG: tRNA (N6-isopentenyl adenosine(37)-C2)-methylthiotransferase MiaB [Oscillospiraceae bacterium]|nr:tRNA (N6-isopentenyl adenosine(37)-C2)-methylthiotransferase MiaB [Oscillospiraceae bacterium]MBQ2157742.1 tRNA (N6-isopentenyl adenosine(37)-C2)-methylthiotransferase MiaB [Oscillospiraceae bacterium]MBQ3951861.1 tRNA (N6-isopentenyl adenosine(37)-C2)-methylthiotransferase MiaB [Oscillospiraceae bacterium]MBQ5503738.1 tRNA (N6-isopentenyl adenosine(37)-C2)-methylthiotransferase MiaB [Oscillospiraceae bacterium]MBQ5568670.1 tRNA (N6-isopentenyl adenosine(37)-C2)-methylthiotransferase MiaB [O
MSYKRTVISEQELEAQKKIMAEVAERNASLPEKPLALVDTYGCQQNEADSEKLRGMLLEMGYGLTQDEAEADVVVMNTCAVREHAEQRVYGNVGALTHTKKAKPTQKIAVCGCMAQQKSVADRLKASYRHVDMVFGPHALWRFPEFLRKVLFEGGRVFEITPSDGAIAEGLPSSRDGRVKAWLSVMYGCNNFCTYCIVPYVRGRERSRMPEDIIKEAHGLIDAGYKDVTLLGQNVNSYGRDLGLGVDFSDILAEISAIPGDFRLRFMTSHPKDATEKLFRTMAGSDKIAKHIHLPFQSGSSRVLKAMNRSYDRERYLSLVELARSYMPDIVLTSDVIVGFPGETEEDFLETMSLVESVRFDALFTFIYSKRPGTPAASYPDPATREEKQDRFDRLIALQNSVSEEKHRAYIGKTERVLIDGEDNGLLTSRTDGGRLVRLEGDNSLIGSFREVKITGSNTWALSGELI